MSETAQAYQWIMSTCLADSALMAAATAVCQGVAPIGTVAPYVLIQRQAGSDVLTSAAVRLFVHILVQIKAVGPTANYAALVTIANRIDALFGNQRDISLPGGGGVLASYREQELALPEPELVNGAPWENLGGIYHIELQGS